jgi:hypothetical protein
MDFKFIFLFAPLQESSHYIEWMTNASLGLRFMHLYHNRFHATFTAVIALMVNIGFDSARGKADLSP